MTNTISDSMIVAKLGFLGNYKRIWMDKADIRIQGLSETLEIDDGHHKS